MYPLIQADQVLCNVLAKMKATFEGKLVIMTQ